MQGFNMGRYVPPDMEGVMSGNQIHGKHALGARANKISQGILTVRFEMPFPIWCTTCPKPTIIGQGVRFNAEKKKVGNYYSSPIFSFRMKHVACGGWIEIRTDPKNTAYVVTEGAKKRDLGDDKVEEGDFQILTQGERDELNSNAFAAVEGKSEDKERLKQSKDRIEELQDLSEQHWDDPYAANRKLRKLFREGRHARERDAAVTELLQNKMGLGIDLLPEHEDDLRRAQLMEFGELDDDKALTKAISKPLFPMKEKLSIVKDQGSRISRKQKAEDVAKAKTANAIAEIRDNTRAAIDPFLLHVPRPIQRSLLLGVKRKRPDSGNTIVSRAGSKLLVNYESDSD